MKRFDTQRLATNAAAPQGRRGGFMRSEDGSLVIFGLMIFLLMLIAGGMGVDFMRFEAQRARLQATLDRAVLAAASMDQPLDPKSVVLDYFDKAGLAPYIDAGDIQVTDTLTSRRVEASAAMEVGASFLRFSGIDSLTAPAMGAAQESASQTEISLILDTSGSMSWASRSGNSKISELRSAAKQFVNIVLCDPAYPNRTSPCVVEDGKISVTIVPYSEQVLVGESLLGYFNATDEHDYSSCVTFDPGDFSSTSINPTQLLQRTGHFDPWTWQSYRSAGPDNNRTCQTDSWREITAVSGSAAQLRSEISGLGASGNTSIDIGMKWGAAFLNPDAKPVVNNLIAAGKTAEDYAGRPLDWDERGVEKVIVLMTDGVNTNQHYLHDGFRSGPSPVWRTNEKVSSGRRSRYYYSVYRESTDEYYWWNLGRWEDHPYGTGTYENCGRYGCYSLNEGGDGADQMDFVDLWEEKPWAWWDQFGWLDEQGSEYGNGVKNDRLQAICSAAKDQDITVFTVGFEVTQSSATVMRECASSPAHYFDANGLNLSSAFAAIAREISKLRLVN